MRKQFDYLSCFGEEQKPLTPEEVSKKLEEFEQKFTALQEENKTLKKTNEDLQSKVNSLKITGLTKQVEPSAKVEEPEEVQLDFDF